MLHKIRYRRIGGHVHCKMWTGYQPGNMGLNGELVFRDYEFADFRKAQQGIIWFEEEVTDTNGEYRPNVFTQGIDKEAS